MVSSTGVGLGGRCYIHKVWIGKWYKPWTWFRYVYKITELRLHEISLVSNPVDGLCRINCGD